jgi:DNA (cytosine-5)-methyltransferase 1
MPSSPLRVAGLFAGIAGLERGLHLGAGAEPALLCEWWEPARQVLAHRYPGVELAADIRDVRSLPRVDVLTAGFPCTDLSQAGRTAGIDGDASGLVREVFRLLATARPAWLVLENVRNMLVLDGGRAMRFLVDELEERGYRWAYRVVDSRAFGVPQRRQRVVLVASRTGSPASVLFADEAGEPPDVRYRERAFGFYWTEGLRGLGWAQDAVPTLKGGSTIGIPSPPGVWLRNAAPGMRLVTPSIESAEVMQGFPRGWTEAAAAAAGRRGHRWKLVGNAVTVGVAEWLGGRLVEPGRFRPSRRVSVGPGKWPLAAWGERGRAYAADVSMWPIHARYTHLDRLVTVQNGTPISARAVTGFRDRMRRSTLRFDDEFRAAVEEHARVLA